MPNSTELANTIKFLLANFDANFEKRLQTWRKYLKEITTESNLKFEKQIKTWREYFKETQLDLKENPNNGEESNFKKYKELKEYEERLYKQEESEER